MQNLANRSDSKPRSTSASVNFWALFRSLEVATGHQAVAAVKDCVSRQPSRKQNGKVTCVAEERIRCGWGKSSHSALLKATGPGRFKDPSLPMLVLIVAPLCLLQCSVKTQNLANHVGMTRLGLS